MLQWERDAIECIWIMQVTIGIAAPDTRLKRTNLLRTVEYLWNDTRKFWICKFQSVQKISFRTENIIKAENSHLNSQYFKNVHIISLYCTYYMYILKYLALHLLNHIIFSHKSPIIVYVNKNFQ